MEESNLVLPFAFSVRFRSPKHVRRKLHFPFRYLLLNFSKNGTTGALVAELLYFPGFLVRP